MLRSNNLILKPPSHGDYDLLRKIRPCDEYYLMVGEDSADSFFLNDEKFHESFAKTIARENYWFVFKKADVIGVAFLHSIDTTDRRARYAVGIYNKENWNKGYGQEITQTVLNYAFQKLNLHKVDLRVLDYNKRAIAVYENIGFVREGILRENAFINNKWYDDIIMSILCHEFYRD